MSDTLFQQLETRIESLVRNSQKMKEENAFLREMVDELEKERTEWQEKHAQARARIERVLEHLNAMDATTHEPQ
ncbi:MAG: cell division protein ZapB [Gammaproteobacteria bacterium]